MITPFLETEFGAEISLPLESTMGKKNKEGTIDDQVVSSSGRTTAAKGQEYLGSQKADSTSPYRVDVSLDEHAKRCEVPSGGSEEQIALTPEQVQQVKEYLSGGVRLYTRALRHYARTLLRQAYKVVQNEDK